MRKLVCIIGVIVSLALLVAGGALVWATVEVGKEAATADLEGMTGLDLDALMELMDGGESAPAQTPEQSQPAGGSSMLGMMQMLEESAPAANAGNAADAAAMAGMLEGAEGEDVLAALAPMLESLSPVLAKVLPVVLAVVLMPAVNTVATLGIFWISLCGVLLLTGLFGLLLSLYGYGAACGNKKQIKLLKKIAAHQAAPAPVAAPVRQNAPVAPAAGAPQNRPVSSGRWICPVCAMENAGTAATCVCCGEKQPKAQ